MYYFTFSVWLSLSVVTLYIENPKDSTKKIFLTVKTNKPVEENYRI